MFLFAVFVTKAEVRDQRLDLVSISNIKVQALL